MIITQIFFFCFLLIALFFPKKGIIARWRQNSLFAQKTAVEDALKIFLDSEEKNIEVRKDTLARSIHLSSQKTAELLNRLGSLRLIASDQELFFLTDEGRAYALRVVRMHRLWERYLAEETSFHETDWHRSAEKREHSLTKEEADVLAAKMGNPPFDPHGDPIPTSDGHLPVKSGKYLKDMLPGEVVAVTHIEDEPNEAYAALIHLGLYPGSQLQLLETTSDAMICRVDGERRIIPLKLRDNVNVAPVSPEETKTIFKNLSEIQIGEEAVVLAISRVCRGAQRRRLLDFGIVPGTIIRPRLQSFFGDPVAYDIRGTTVALRRIQAQQVFVSKK